MSWTHDEEDGSLLEDAEPGSGKEELPLSPNVAEPEVESVVLVKKGFNLQ